jgi:hypothetical protein
MSYIPAFQAPLSYLGTKAGSGTPLATDAPYVGVVIPKDPTRQLLITSLHASLRADNAGSPLATQRIMQQIEFSSYGAGTSVELPGCYMAFRVTGTNSEFFRVVQQESLWPNPMILPPGAGLQLTWTNLATTDNQYFVRYSVDVCYISMPLNSGLIADPAQAIGP